eukprot:TRINITY_DN14371_c0_g1_i1.p1 TRINITY_DN14371_c0_g1~~TRINITY_DN14371_c0_g1_i1.p1  ORF type:complete len:501 (+),score=111.06 TRINITY_DN14371_c0_g1_i1:47-1549(+)
MLRRIISKKETLNSIGRFYCNNIIVLNKKYEINEGIKFFFNKNVKEETFIKQNSTLNNNWLVYKIDKQDWNENRIDTYIQNNLTLPFSMIQNLIRKKQIFLSTTSKEEYNLSKKIENKKKIKRGDRFIFSGNDNYMYMYLHKGSMIQKLEKLENENGSEKKNGRKKKNKNKSGKKISSYDDDQVKLLVKGFLKRIIYQDDDIIAFNKPSGFPIQGKGIDFVSILPIIQEENERLTNNLVSNNSSKDGDEDEKKKNKYSIAHRLDIGTSGVLLIGKNRSAVKYLHKLFLHKKITKEYWAIVCGVPKVKDGRIVLPLKKISSNQVIPLPDYFKNKDRSKRNKHQQQQRSSSSNSNVQIINPDYNDVNDDNEEEYHDKDVKISITEFETAEYLSDNLSLLKLYPETGRTHQLRAACSSALETPILGDSVYNDKNAFQQFETILPSDSINSMHLHCFQLKFNNALNEPIVISADEFPKHFRNTFRYFGINYKSHFSNHPKQNHD